MISLFADNKIWGHPLLVMKQERRHIEDGGSSALSNTPGYIMMNLWPGTAEVHDWLGEFIYTSPLQAQYESVSFTGVYWPNEIYLPLIIQ